MKLALPTSVASLVCVLAACGSNMPEPTPATAPSSTPVAASDPSDAGSPSSTSPGPSSTSAPADTAPADAGSSPATKPSPIVVENKDECTPVGIDFEKRARPKLKDCYQQGKKKEPNLEGTVKIKITVDLKGKIKNVKVIEKTLPDPVAECMLKVVKATPFPEVDKCWDATLTIPITFPTPK